MANVGITRMARTPTVRIAVGGLFIVLPVIFGASSIRNSSTLLIAQQDQKLKDSKFIAEGAKLFQPNCSSAYCHGKDGMGGGAPALRGKGLEAAYLFKTISNGLSGTPMRPFKSDLPEEKIWQLVAYIMSPVSGGDAPTASGLTAAESVKSGPAGAERPAMPAGSSTLTGDPSAGKLLFFDSSQSKSCQSCHSFQGMGAAFGPDLSKFGSRSARELFLAIVMPAEARDQRYLTTIITTKDHETITGIKKEEDADSVRIYDVSELPAVMRTVQKSEIAASETSNASAMPKDYAKIYTLKQLLDIVAFLKSEAKGAVQLKDILQSSSVAR